MNEQNPPPWFERIVSSSAMAGLCGQIPIPFLDDWALSFFQRRMIMRLLSEEGFCPTKGQVELLAEDDRGSLLGCVWSFFLYPLSKIILFPFRLLRKIFFVLALRSYADAFLKVFYEGYLLHYALQEKFLDGLEEEDKVLRVRHAITDACKNADSKMLQQILRGVFLGSRDLFVKASRQIRKRLRKPDEALELPAGEQDLGNLFDRLTGILWREKALLAKLELDFATRVKS